jgi:hypothetical protein
MLFSKTRTHSTVYRKIYEQHFGPIPKDEDGRTYEIHHIDGDDSNNDPNNLVALTIKEHYEVHKSQGDWAACLAMAHRMKVSPAEKSELARLNRQRQEASPDYINPWRTRNDGTSVQQDLVSSGKHHFLKRSDGTSFTSDRVVDGTHPFLHLDQRGKKHPMYKHEVYLFENNVTGESVKMTQKEFTDYYELDFRNVSAIVRGKRKVHKGWVVKGQVTDPT